MCNILIRNVPEETKQRLAERAAKNGRSQNAEAVAILEEALAPEKKSLVDHLLALAEDLEGAELEFPERQPAREPDLWWLKEDAEKHWAAQR